MENIYNLNAYDYPLPEKLITQKPANPPDNCKLLIVEKLNPLSLKDEIFKNIPNYLSWNEIFFFNNTKVIKARIYLNNQNLKLINRNWNISTIKDWEILFLDKIDDNTFKAIVRPWKKFKVWNKLIFDDKVILKIIDYIPEWRIIKSSIPIQELFKLYWHLPLPPYIKFEEEKEKYYQSIFALKPGSIAAPTASLHFTPTLIQKIKNKGCKFEYTTLHVWLGTFKKVDVENITKYNIHEEIAEINTQLFEKIAKYKLNKNPIIAVGTTVTRTLESLPYLWKYLKINNILENLNLSEKTIQFWNDLTKDITNKDSIIKFSPNLLKTYPSLDFLTFKTKLYIYPWFTFKIIDQLITNFHLPKSSLLMLVAAFMGYENMKKTYQYAIEKKYKFFSFWDAMRILK